MLKMSRLFRGCSPAWLVLSLLVLSGCASQVGSVVQAPQVKLPDQPSLVKATPAEPAGYFQRAMTECLVSDACDAQATLLTLLKTADDVNLAYGSCRADAQYVRAAIVDYSLPLGGKIPR